MQTARGEAAQAFLQVLFGEKFDWSSQHFEKTPERFATMLMELTTPQDYKFTVFQSTSDEMVIIKDIPFVSLCAHHIVPFMGMAHIGYIPKGRIAGLSKFARLVQSLSKTLTVQEELTNDILRNLKYHLEPLGAIVLMEAEHLCMTIRGVQTPGTKTITSAVDGVFADHNRTAKAEFMELLKR